MLICLKLFAQNVLSFVAKTVKFFIVNLTDIFTKCIWFSVIFLKMLNIMPMMILSTCITWSIMLWFYEQQHKMTLRHSHSDTSSSITPDFFPIFLISENAFTFFNMTSSCICLQCWKLIDHDTITVMCVTMLSVLKISCWQWDMIGCDEVELDCGRPCSDTFVILHVRDVGVGWVTGLVLPRH